MTYANILDDVFGKRPVWLYHFIKDGEDRFYTSRGTDYSQTNVDFFAQQDFFFGVNFFARTWESIALFRGKIRNTSAIGRAETDITFPQSNTWAQSYVLDNGYEDNEVLIYHLFTNDGDLEQVLKFRGRVIAAKPMLTRITLICENRFTELRRKGLSAVIQRPCRHALYHSRNGYGCNLNIADFETDGVVTVFANDVATVSVASSQSDGYYAGGVFTWQNKRQLILKHTGSSLTLLGPIPGFADAQAAGNQAVKIAPGCDLSRATCNSRFNNLGNFGGFPWADETPYDGKTLF